MTHMNSIPSLAVSRSFLILLWAWSLIFPMQTFAQFHGGAILHDAYGPDGTPRARVGDTVRNEIFLLNFDECNDSLEVNRVVFSDAHSGNRTNFVTNVYSSPIVLTQAVFFNSVQGQVPLTFFWQVLPGDENVPGGILKQDVRWFGTDRRNSLPPANCFRGSPDQFELTFPAQITVMSEPVRTNLCVLEAVSDKWNDGGSRHAVWMPGIYTDFIFTPQFGGWTSNDNGTAHLSGIIRRRDDLSSGFSISVDLGGKTTTPGPDSPKLDLDPQAYVWNGGPIDPATWCYYEDFTGTFNGFGRYDGAVLEIVRFGPAWQIGVGANSKNDNFGAAAWFSWAVLQQPTSGSLPVSGIGDFNIDIFECIPATMGDFVWFDANQNGQQDGGFDEIGVMDVEVRLLACSGSTVLLKHVTDATGSYLFTNLQAGSYRIQVIPPVGATFTPAWNVGSDNTDSDVNPSTGYSACISLNNGMSAANLTLDVGLVPGFAPAPAPRLISVHPLGGGNMEVTLQARRFRNYLIESTVEPSQGWEPLASAWNINGVLKFRDAAQYPNCFYRVKLLP